MKTLSLFLAAAAASAAVKFASPHFAGVGGWTELAFRVGIGAIAGAIVMVLLTAVTVRLRR